MIKMNIKRPWNTKKRGFAESVIFCKDGTWIAVCLTFDILEEGKSYEEVQKALTSAIELHIETIQKENLPDALLNRYAPDKYWDLYFKATAEKSKKKLIGGVAKNKTLPFFYTQPFALSC